MFASFDERAANWSPAAGEDTTAEVSDNACRDGEIVVELDEIVIFIERDIVGQRIVRPLRDDGRQRERLGQCRFGVEEVLCLLSERSALFIQINFQEMRANIIGV